MANGSRSTTGQSEHYFDAATAGASAPHFDPSGSFVATLANSGDVELNVTIELGRAEMVQKDVLELRAGIIVPLDALVGDPVDVVVGRRVVARGEAVVVDDKYCVRVLELVAAAGAV